jgi:DNA-binding transcriptional LysR family regulator
VTLTSFGETLVRHARVSFDDLAQGLRSIVFEAAAGVGEVVVAADMSFIAGGLMAEIILDLAIQAPGVRVNVIETTTRTRTPSFRELRERDVDLVLGRVSVSDADTELHVEPLREEELLVVAGSGHPFAGPRSPDWEALACANWMLASRDNMARTIVTEAFKANGVALPEPAITTYSMHLRLQLLQSGHYLTVMPDTAFRHSAARWDLVALQVHFTRRLPVALVSLKNRSLAPPALRFVASARRIANGFASQSR